MSIVSLQFLVFLAILTAIYFLVPKKGQWIVLLLGSVFFYIVVGGLIGLAFVFVTSFTIWLSAKKVEKLEGRAKKALAHLTVAFNLGLLIVLKYGMFLLKELSELLRVFGVVLVPVEFTPLLPLGISFYTLQAIGYLLDVLHGKEKAETNFFKLALFVSYFPQIIQGPFSRYREIGDQLLSSHEWDYIRVKYGIERMVWGYFMKLVVGDRLVVIVSEITGNYIEHGHEGLTILIGMMLYSVQLYADFLGGIHIVCGASEIFGINLPENFRQPFFAKSVSEFWQRWHMTLGNWMKVYVFYPIALSPSFSKMGKWLKQHVSKEVGKVVPASLASFFVFLLVGMWHGADTRYVVYAIYQATLVSSHSLLEQPYAKMRAFFHVNDKAFSWRAFQTVRTYLIMVIGRYFSMADSLDHAIGLLRSTFATFNPWVLWDETFFNLGLNRQNMVLSLIMIVVLLVVDIAHEKGISIRKKLDETDVVTRWAVYLIVVFSIVVFGMYGADVVAHDFIYQGF